MINISQPSYKIVDAFDTAYWSGSDVSVFARTSKGHVLLDEAVQLSYSIQEQVMPYYSYNRFVFDEVHHGTRIINGELTINFKHSGYVFALLKSITELVGPQSVPTATPKSVTTSVQSLGLAQTKLQDPSVAADFVNQYRQIYDLQQQDQVYGQLNTQPVSTKAMFNSPFDLDILFGAQYNNSLTLKIQDGADEFYTDGLVIANQDNLNQPILMGRRLVDVHIMGITKTMADDGRPFMETYTFIAQDVQTLTSRDIKGNY